MASLEGRMKSVETGVGTLESNMENRLKPMVDTGVETLDSTMQGWLKSVEDWVADVVVRQARPPQRWGRYVLTFD